MAYLGLGKGGAWRARRARAGTLFAFECFLLFECSMEAANSSIFSEIRKRRKSQRHIRCNLTWQSLKNFHGRAKGGASHCGPPPKYATDPIVL